MNSETRIDPTDGASSTDQTETLETVSKPEQDRRYSSEEVADIIRISLQDQERRDDDTVDYKELLAIAGEMGVDSDQIARSVRRLEEEQLTHDKEDLLWARFRAHGYLFIGVSLLCVTINVLSSAATFWSMYVIFGWGLFLLGHYAGLRLAPQFVETAMERTRQAANNHYQNFFDDDSNVGFSTTDATGMTETQGLVSIEEDKLIVEYQTVDAMLGVIKTKVKAAEIPIQELTSVRLEQRLWSVDLVAQGKNMRVFKNAPGSKGGKLKLRVNRQSARAAVDLVQDIRAIMEADTAD